MMLADRLIHFEIEQATEYLKNNRDNMESDTILVYETKIIWLKWVLNNPAE